MKKYRCCILLTLLLLGSTTAPAFAATNQANMSQRDVVQAHNQRHMGWSHFHHRWRRFGYPSVSHNNQYLHNCRIHIKNKAAYGANQGNDGNQGINLGNTRDNSGNEGNQAVNHGGWGWRRNNQITHMCGLTVNNQFFRGFNQGNDGNQGVNRGNIEDNSSNEGNQIIN